MRATWNTQYPGLHNSLQSFVESIIFCRELNKFQNLLFWKNIKVAVQLSPGFNLWKIRENNTGYITKELGYITFHSHWSLCFQLSLLEVYIYLYINNSHFPRFSAKTHIHVRPDWDTLIHHEYFRSMLSQGMKCDTVQCRLLRKGLTVWRQAFHSHTAEAKCLMEIFDVSNQKSWLVIPNPQQGSDRALLHLWWLEKFCFGLLLMCQISTS